MGKERGRPTKYSKALADRICERLAEGRSLREVCREPDMPHEATVRGWAVKDKDGFFTHYTQAREIGYHAMADELLEISDDGRNDFIERLENDERPNWYEYQAEHVQRSRLRVDTRKWMLSKALPKIYGDRLAVEHDVSDKLAERLDQARERAKKA